MDESRGEAEFKVSSSENPSSVSSANRRMIWSLEEASQTSSHVTGLPSSLWVDANWFSLWRSGYSAAAAFHAKARDRS